ncbi:hypothetical protein HY486_04920 [Candidatus Woesearchaeota archaeon]|nr:hypothetical protein [Candidatus Woesearchaeota archaeon]
MISKIKAASKVKMTVIANAKEEKVLSKILSGDDIGTLLLNRKPKQSP